MADYNMMGIQFSNVGGSAKDLSTVVLLDDTFAGFSDEGDFYTTLRVWNGNGYTTYGWAGKSGTDVFEDSTLDYTWTDLDAEAVTGETMPPSSAMWIRAEKAGTMLVSGEVLSSNLVVPLNPDYNMVANPYPCDVPVSTFGKLDPTFSGFSDEGDFYSTLRIWTGNGYNTFGWAGASGTAVFDDPTLDNTWTDLDACVTDAVVPAGAGVWIRAEKAGTITFTPAN